MMISVLVTTTIGSYLAKFLPDHATGSAMQIGLIIVGLRFLFKPVMTTKQQLNDIPKKEKTIKAIIGDVLLEQYVEQLALVAE